jgi:Mrp family chromosome partitioning ATPase
MTAKIIATVNQKGGCGKTTISMQLAGALALRGNRILVVDADPQGTPPSPPPSSASAPRTRKSTAR